MITILTAASNEYWPLLEITAPNKLAYALRWGHQLVIRRHQEAGEWGEREIFMSRALLSTDWLFFCGSDTLFTNFKIDMYSFLGTDAHMIIGNDLGGINNDAFFLRNCPESFAFLAAVLSKNTTVSNDQTAMNMVMQEMPEFKVMHLHQKAFNAYLQNEYPGRPCTPEAGHWEPGDFLLHTPGLPLARRIVLARNHLKKVIE